MEDGGRVGQYSDVERFDEQEEEQKEEDETPDDSPVAFHEFLLRSPEPLAHGLSVTRRAAGS